VLDLTRVLEDGPHQPVHRGKTELVLEAQGPGDRRLMVEEQPVGPPAGLQV
jgi:hypothetical protein